MKKRKCDFCSYVFEKNEFSCPECGINPLKKNGFQLLSPQLMESEKYFCTEAFDHILRLEEGYFWFDYRNRLIVDIIKEYFSHSRSFCEFGCGTGYVLSYISTIFPKIEVFGSDAYPEALSVAKKRNKRAHLFQSDVCEPSLNEVFDLVGAFDVLEHITGDQLALNSLYRATRPGGGVILTVPQHRWLWSRQDELANHRRRYDREELIKKAEGAGFNTVLVTSFVTVLFPLMMLSRLFQKYTVKKEMVNDALTEFKIPSFANTIFKGICMLERYLINRRLNFVFGGSLIYVGLKKNYQRN